VTVFRELHATIRRARIAPGGISTTTVSNSACMGALRVDGFPGILSPGSYQGRRSVPAFERIRIIADLIALQRDKLLQNRTDRVEDKNTPMNTRGRSPRRPGIPGAQKDVVLPDDFAFLRRTRNTQAIGRRPGRSFRFQHDTQSLFFSHWPEGPGYNWLGAIDETAMGTSNNRWDHRMAGPANQA